MMATGTMIYTGPADGLASATFTQSADSPDANAPYFFACYRSVYGNYLDNITGKVTPSDKDAKGTPNAIAKDTHIWARYCQGIREGTEANINNYLKEQARAQAEAQVATISLSPKIA